MILIEKVPLYNIVYYKKNSLPLYMSNLSVSKILINLLKIYLHSSKIDITAFVISIASPHIYAVASFVIIILNIYIRFATKSANIEWCRSFSFRYCSFISFFFLLSLHFSRFASFFSCIFLSSRHFDTDRKRFQKGRHISAYHQCLQ